MPNEQKAIHKKLHQELAHIHFSGSEEVLKRTHPKTFSQKLSEWWNKEVSIFLLPVGIVMLLIISVITIPTVPQDTEINVKNRELIQVGGNFYWKDLFEEVSKK